MKLTLSQCENTTKSGITMSALVKYLGCKISLWFICFNLMNAYQAQAQNQALQQDWSPFPANQKTWFKFTSETINAVALYYAANVIEQENEIQYYLDANNTAYLKEYDVLHPCRQYFQDRAQDFVSIWEPFVEQNSLHFYQDQLVFDANLNVGEGIFIQSPDYQGFDEVYLECIDQRTEDVFGQNDEVKEFSLQAYANGQPVASAFNNYGYTLSKTYGFLRFLPFIELLKKPKTNATITGFEDEQGMLRGDKGNQFILPYGAGDVLYYFHEFGTDRIRETTKNWRDSITSVIQYQDSLVYTFDRVEFIKTEISPLPPTYDTIYTYNNTKNIIYDRDINELTYYIIYGYRGNEPFKISQIESQLYDDEPATVISIFNYGQGSGGGCLNTWSLTYYSRSYRSDIGKIHDNYNSDDTSFSTWRISLYQKNGEIVYAPFPQLDAVYNQFDAAIQLNTTAEGPGVSGNVFYPYQVSDSLLNVPFDLTFKIGIWEFTQTVMVNGTPDALANADPIFKEYV